MKKTLLRCFRGVWLLWSFVLTSTLVIALAALVFFEYSSLRALDPDQIALMPAPDLIASGAYQPFQEPPRVAKPDDFGVFYATDRAPATDADAERYYTSERGHVLRVGVAQVRLGEQQITWEEAARITREKERDREYPLRVTDAREFGVLRDTLTPFDAAAKQAAEKETQATSLDEEFIHRVNEKLRSSHRKELVIYVHGYKVVFENPLLVATELWHYLGYDGVFLAYAWPSTPNFAAYFSDLETAAYSSRNLRILIESLARETEVERIHVLGYSAGTRLVLGAVNQISLLNHDATNQEIQDRYRLGTVVLACSDVDRQIFGNQLADGAWRVPSQWTVYLSELDSTLDMARMVFGRKRLGRLVEGDAVSPALADFLRSQDRFSLVDVSRAENADANNGHAYFHKSPWVSSDLLLTFATSRPPGERGLVKKGDSPIWEFPDDYVARLGSLANLPSNQGDAPEAN